MDRYFMVEATTPKGDIELSGEALHGTSVEGVMREAVREYANDNGYSEQDVVVTHSWSMDAR